MREHVQNIFKAAMIVLLSFATFHASAHGKGKGKGHHKSDHHYKIAGPPSWAPAHGHYKNRRHATRYAYNPDYNIYYDRVDEVYIYVRVGRWEVSARLPYELSHRSVRNGFIAEANHIDYGPRHPRRVNRRVYYEPEVHRHSRHCH